MNNNAKQTEQQGICDHGSSQKNKTKPKRENQQRMHKIDRLESIPNQKDSHHEQEKFKLVNGRKKLTNRLGIAVATKTPINPAVCKSKTRAMRISEEIAALYNVQLKTGCIIKIKQ